jgi:hypothetical protein
MLADVLITLAEFLSDLARGGPAYDQLDHVTLGRCQGGEHVLDVLFVFPSDQSVVQVRAGSLMATPDLS